MVVVTVLGLSSSSPPNTTTLVVIVGYGIVVVGTGNCGRTITHGGSHQTVGLVSFQMDGSTYTTPEPPLFVEDPPSDPESSPI